MLIDIQCYRHLSELNSECHMYLPHRRMIINTSNQITTRITQKPYAKTLSLSKLHFAMTLLVTHLATEDTDTSPIDTTTTLGAKFTYSKLHSFDLKFYYAWASDVQDAFAK